MIKDDGTVIHFNNPKVQAAPSANTFAVSGQAENKSKFLHAFGLLGIYMTSIFWKNRTLGLQKLFHQASMIVNCSSQQSRKQ